MIVLLSDMKFQTKLVVSISLFMKFLSVAILPYVKGIFITQSSEQILSNVDLCYLLYINWFCPIYSKVHHSSRYLK